MTRLSKDNYYLGIAEAVSKRSTCLRANCGAIIVNNDAIISTGYNGNPRGMENCVDKGTCPRSEYKPNEGRHLCHAVHAEMNCFVNIARSGGVTVKGSTIYVWFKRLDDSRNSYNKPCDDCWKHIMNSGVVRIINYTEDKYHTTMDETSILNDGSGKWNTIRLGEIIK